VYLISSCSLFFVSLGYSRLCFRYDSTVLIIKQLKENGIKIGVASSSKVHKRCVFLFLFFVFCYYYFYYFVILIILIIILYFNYYYFVILIIFIISFFFVYSLFRYFFISLFRYFITVVNGLILLELSPSARKSQSHFSFRRNPRRSRSRAR
jgi:hypothetical protein